MRATKTRAGLTTALALLVAALAIVGYLVWADDERPERVRTAPRARDMVESTAARPRSRPATTVAPAPSSTTTTTAAPIVVTPPPPVTAPPVAEASPDPPPAPAPPPPSLVEVCATTIAQVELPAGWGRECVEGGLEQIDGSKLGGLADSAAKMIYVDALAWAEPWSMAAAAWHEAGHAWTLGEFTSAEWDTWHDARGFPPDGNYAQVAEDAADAYACVRGYCQMSYGGPRPTTEQVTLLWELLA